MVSEQHRMHLLHHPKTRNYRCGLSHTLCIVSFRLVYYNHCEGSLVYPCNHGFKGWIHPVGIRTLFELIGRMQSATDWDGMMSYCGLKLWRLGPASRGSHPKSAGRCSNEDITWGILENHPLCPRDGCYDVFEKKNEGKKKSQEIKQWYSMAESSACS